MTPCSVMRHVVIMRAASHDEPGRFIINGKELRVQQRRLSIVWARSLSNPFRGGKMVKEENPRKALSRRTFLKAAGTTGALAAAGAMTGCDGWLSSAEDKPSASDETVVYVPHRFHCRCYCSLKVTVRQGRVCLIEPNDAY